MTVMAWEKVESVAVLNMTNQANKQNLGFAEEMNACFDDILADQEIFSLVISSSDEKNFSQGIDVEWLGEKFNAGDHDAVKKFMYAMNRVFTRLLLMPIPVIAAINGHAFGNGAILACACDFRFMKSDRGFFCFPEVDLGIPFLPGMIAFVKKAVPAYKFNEMKLTGRRVTAEELEKHHVIEKASADLKELKNDVMAFAGSFHKKRNIFGEHKKRMHKEIVEIIETQDPEFIDSMNLFVQ